MSVHVIVLAAGKGTRMRSNLPKVLHTLAGRPLLRHVLDTAIALESVVSVVYGHGGDAVRQAINDDSINWVLQDQQLGTGHAVKLAMPGVSDADTVLVMYGDVPLIHADTLAALVDESRNAGGLAVLTMALEQPGAYGRILRGSDGVVQAIVEAGDATAEQLAIREINTGFVAAPAGQLRKWVARLEANNAQGEFYLTDIVALAVADGGCVSAVQASDAWEIEGVNSRKQLAALERVYQHRQAEALMEHGVTLADPARLDIRGLTEIGRDSFVDINVVFEGDNSLGENVSIGPNCHIMNSRIAHGATIHANSVLENADVGPNCNVGPFARLRPGSVLAENARIGNFVETKKAEIGAGSKVNHLSYVGDSEVGSNVNIGAGVITCNYDGVNKHKTVIKDNAFIGSDSQLIAPVTVGEGAFIGSGTTLSRNAPDGELTLTRSPQRTVKGWKPPVKKP